MRDYTVPSVISLKTNAGLFEIHLTDTTNTNLYVALKGIVSAQNQSKFAIFSTIIC